MRTAALLVVPLLVWGCKHDNGADPAKGSGGMSTGSGAPSARAHDALPRADFNRWAVRLDLPVYWIADANKNNAIEPDETASLLFYQRAGNWVANGKFTPDFEAAYDQLVAAAKAPPAETTSEEGKRQALVAQDLDAGRATLVRSDFTAASAGDKAFVAHLLSIAKKIDALYALQNGTSALPQPKDAASQRLLARNRGPKCVGPTTEKDPLCSALPGSPRVPVGVYPAELQTDDKFCGPLEARKDAAALTTPFTVVQGSGADLKAVPYTDAWKDAMHSIADELSRAADEQKDPSETPLVAYLSAAAKGFDSNDWLAADEAWAKMTVDNSKWFVRVGPDEVYWEPCSHKAGFHLTFAKINQGSKEWQAKLLPVQQEMEAAVAQHAGAPYVERKVTFHLPDFIDIIVNAGDDRTPLGATIGQSLPNWGPVANEGRGRTVAMVNLYQDPDSAAARRAQAESVLDPDSIKWYSGAPDASLLVTILHEATHNLGPAHEYKVNGKAAGAIFGGGLASVMEELKAQTGGLFLIDFLRKKGLITEAQAQASYADAIVWAFGHISQGMYSGGAAKQRKTYGNVAAIQIGFLLDHGALTWDPKAPTANGKDVGAFAIHPDKLVGAIDEMMTTVAGIKARGDAKAAEALAAKYVDGPTVPQQVIAERFLRFPKASFVYAVAQ